MDNLACNTIDKLFQSMTGFRANRYTQSGPHFKALTIISQLHGANDTAKTIRFQMPIPFPLSDRPITACLMNYFTFYPCL